MTRNGWRSLAVALAAVAPAMIAPAAEASGKHRTTSVTSPDRRIAVAFEVDRQGRPTYRVSRDGAPLIADSGLGFRFAGAPALGVLEHPLYDLRVASCR